MKTIKIENSQAMEGEVMHDIAIRNKTNKKGEERNRMVFKDNAGFIRMVSETTTELKINEGIKGFSWMAAVPEDEFEPIYDSLCQLFEKYGDAKPTNKSTEQLEKEKNRLEAKLARLMAILG